MKKSQPFVFIAFIVYFSIIPSFAEVQNNLNKEENTQLVKTGNKFITLVGKQLSVNDDAPNFKAVDNSFSAVELSDFSEKNILISVVPSLDTGVCSIQTKRFNEAVATLNNDTIILTISNDLPFAQRRFCLTENINDLTILSDAVWHDFAYKYGVMIKDMGLLTRAIFIINKQQKLVYKELVENIADEPNYDAALSALSTIKNVVTLPEEAMLSQK